LTTGPNVGSMESAGLMRVGIIDLGSNTARLVVMNSVPGYSFRLADEIREVVRLRQGMTKKGLSDEAVARAFSTLRMFKRYCDSTEVDVILPTATSAVREAANGADFVKRVEDEIGLSLRILDGEKEAYYGTLGALNEVRVKKGFVLDVGGGSAQISEVRDGWFKRGKALSLGALALTERFVQSDPPSRQEVKAIEHEIKKDLATIKWLKPRAGMNVIGLGGSIRNVAKIDSQRKEFPLNTLHGYRLSRKSVESILKDFLDKPLEKRLKISGLNPDRADIITAGALVLRCVMDALDASEVTISIGGLREGIFFEHFWEHLPYPVMPDVRRYGVLNLARSYHYQKSHVNHVRFLAERLFEQLSPLHGLGKTERELLDAAAMLHDLGTVIGYEGHHKHSHTLIDYNGLPGFTPRQIALIGLIARYHRQGSPELGAYRSLLDQGDLKLLQCLSSILRLSEFLERGRNAAVDDVVANWDDDTLRLTLIADEHPAVELWEAERKAAPLAEQVFGRRVVLDSIAPPTDGTASVTREGR
jgi:exopolyphosphatase/guanosine-5'-triphosphate,3'-diphosphate pyrophosphatase